MILRFMLFPAVWSLVIALFTIMPGSNMPSTKYFFSFDKAAHAFVFAVLVFLLIVACAKQFTSEYLKQKHVVAGFTLPVLYGIAIEFIQAMVPDRGFSVNDMLADTVGCLFGLIFFYLVYKL